MLNFPFDSMRFVRYAPTSLERNFQHVVLTEPDLGIPIDLIDPDAYKITPEQKGIWSLAKHIYLLSSC